MGGKLGAFIAVPLIQFIGIAVIIPILALMSWGIILLRKKGIPFFWFKFTTLLFCIPLTAGAFTLFDYIYTVSEEWPSASLGGYIGIHGIGQQGQESMVDKLKERDNLLFKKALEFRDKNSLVYTIYGASKDRLKV